MVATTLEASALTEVRKTKRGKILHAWLAITMRRRLLFATEKGCLDISACSANEQSDPSFGEVVSRWW